MLYIKSALIGMALGSLISGTATYFIVKERYEKKFEEWQTDYIRYRADLRHRAIQREAERSVREDDVTLMVRPAEAEREGAQPKSFEKEDEEYESAVSEYSTETQDPNGEDEETDEEEEMEHNRLGLSDDDIHECLRRIEKDGFTIEEMADRFDISKQALQILIDEYKTRIRSKRDYPKFATPYVIDEEAYETEMLHHGKEDLIYYRGDEVILNAETDEQIIEIGKYLGKPSNLYPNKENSEHYIFIRNDVEAVDYRIFCDTGRSDGE